MRNKILVPSLIAIWTTIIITAIDITITGSKLMHFNGSHNLNNDIDSIILRLFIMGIIISVVIYIVLNNVAQKITRPINELIEDANNSRKGEYKHQLRDYGIEELQNLAYAFDNMGGELGGTIRKLKHQNAKLESMFDSLEEGIIVLDKKGYIDETNELAKQLLGVNDIILNNQFQITHLIRDDEFIQLVDRVTSSNTSEDMELRTGELILYITMVPVVKNDKVYAYILLIRDITRLRSLEELRYQFVTNVSHELKTPLTSIQGFVETLKSGAINDPKVANKFLNIIDIEAKRLYRLIQDILLLSEIENMDKQSFGDVIVTECIQNCIMILQKQAEDKHIKLIFENKADIVAINVREDHMTQLIMNLVSNAIRYTEEGEVVVRTMIKENKQVIVVSDTGIGIPKDSLSHIFERFYTVDKSRSRKNGGTGLGLSIVKHIAELYKISIKVESIEGSGTSFILEI